jgi:hypothetical protein
MHRRFKRKSIRIGQELSFSHQNFAAFCLRLMHRNLTRSREEREASNHWSIGQVAEINIVVAGIALN